MLYILCIRYHFWVFWIFTLLDLTSIVPSSFYNDHTLVIKFPDGYIYWILNTAPQLITWPLPLVVTLTRLWQSAMCRPLSKWKKIVIVLVAHSRIMCLISEVIIAINMDFDSLWLPTLIMDSSYSRCDHAQKKCQQEWNAPNSWSTINMSRCFWSVEHKWIYTQN